MTTGIALCFKQQTLDFALPCHTCIPRCPWRTHTSPYSVPMVSPPLCSTQKTLHVDTQETQISTYMDLGQWQHLSTAHENTHCSATSSHKPPCTWIEYVGGRRKNIRLWGHQGSHQIHQIQTSCFCALCQTSWTIFSIRELMLRSSILCCPIWVFSQEKKKGYSVKSL